MKKFNFCLILFLTIIIGNQLAAAPILDSRGSYSDDFSDNTGLAARSYVRVDEANGILQLTNSLNGLMPPFVASGYAITQTVIPSSVVQWGKFDFVATTPAGTSVKIQVLDSENTLFPDSLLPGNSAGFDTSPIDLTNLPVLIGAWAGKPLKLQFKIILSTDHADVSPSVNSIYLSFIPRSYPQPKPAPLAGSGWPIDSVDLRATYHTPYSNIHKYSVIRWKTRDLPQTSFIINNLIYDSKLIAENWWADSKLYGIDRYTGRIFWEKTLWPWGRGSITRNGFLYATDEGNDIFYAVDTKTGELKWTYDFQAGHGNSQVAIGTDGTLYTIRQQNCVCPSSFCDSQTFTLYAFDPRDGTVKWKKDFFNANEFFWGERISVGQSGTLYLMGNTFDLTSDQPTNHGQLFALNPSDGSTKWTYDTGNMRGLPPIIDTDETIYLLQSDWTWDPSTDKKMYAIKPNGTLKWERNIGPNSLGWTNASLRSDGVIVAAKMPAAGGAWEIEKIRTTDGTLVSTTFLDPSLFSIDQMYTDGHNGTYIVGIYIVDPEESGVSAICYYDAEFNLLWKYTAPLSSIGSLVEYYGFSQLTMDERGWIYSGYGKSVYDSVTQEEQLDQEYSNIFALAPWTLSVSAKYAKGRNYLKPGETVTFVVNSSMSQTNLLTGSPNQVQIVIDNGDKVPLTCRLPNVLGSTVWTGSYKIPYNTTPGRHRFKVEACAANMVTDIPVHFDTPAEQSNNTGYIVEGAFSVNLSCSH